MVQRKTARKTAGKKKPAPRRRPQRKPPRGQPFTGKDDPRNGKGKKGRSGRPSLKFKEECDNVARDVILKKITAYLKKNAIGAGEWHWCAEWICRYAPETQLTQQLLGEGQYMLMGGILPGMLKPEHREAT